MLFRPREVCGYSFFVGVTMGNLFVSLDAVGVSLFRGSVSSFIGVDVRFLVSSNGG